MQAAELLRLIKDGESSVLEFKESFGDGVIETLAAMANSGGGRVLAGVTDAGVICGVAWSQQGAAAWLNEVKQKTSPSLYPDLHFLRAGDSRVAVFTIKEVPIKPVSMRGRCLARRGAANHLMSLQEIADMYLKTYNLSWDSLPDPGKSTSDLASAKVERFRNLLEKQAAAALPEDSFTLLKKFSLLREEKAPTFAASLLFGKTTPLSAAVHAVRFKGTDKEESSEDFYIQEDLVSEIELIMAFMLGNIKRGVKKAPVSRQLTHDPVWQYPPEALRELVINLVVHRDYHNGSPSCVFIFDDRIEMWNPGEMPKGLSLDKIQSGDYAPSARNPLITRVFKEIGLIENIGSGLHSVFTMIKKHGGPPPAIDSVSAGTRIVLRSAAAAGRELAVGSQKGSQKNSLKATNEKTAKSSLKSSQKSSQKILKLIKSDPHISIAELASLLGISDRGVKNVLESLKKAGLVKRIGPDRGGHWRAK